MRRSKFVAGSVAWILPGNIFVLGIAGVPRADIGSGSVVGAWEVGRGFPLWGSEVA